MLQYMLTNIRTGRTLVNVTIEDFSRAKAFALRDSITLPADVLESIKSNGVEISATVREMAIDMCDFIITGKEYDKRIITHRLDPDHRFILTVDYKPGKA